MAVWFKYSCLVFLQSVILKAAGVNIKSEKMTYEVGETITINCTTVTTHSALSIEWYFNSQLIPEELYDVISSDLSQLIIHDSNFSHAGNYSCALLGDLLEDVATLKIQVGEKPHPAANFSCHSFDGFDILCTWDEGGTTNLPTTHTLKYKSLYYGGGWRDCPDVNRSIDCPGIHDFTYSCHLEFFDHHEGSLHNFTVIAENVLGSTATSIFYNPDDEGTPFPPENVAATAMDDSCIQISWDYPCGWMHPIYGGFYFLQYRLRWKSEWEPDKWLPVPPIKQEYDRERTQCDFEGYTQYNIQVSTARTGQDSYWSDWTDLITVRTLEQAPISRLQVSYGDSKDNAEDPTKRDVAIRWKPLGVREMKGAVLGYTLTLKEDSTNNMIEVNTSVEARSYEFKALMKYLSYSVTVVTFNSAGSSPPTTLKILDLASAPSEPRNVNAVSIDKNSILVTWDPPLNSHGIIKEYKIYWSRSGYDELNFDTLPIYGPSQELKYEVTGLHEYVQYELQIRAFTVIGGGGLSTTVYQYTLEGIPSGPPRHILVETVHDSPSSLQLTWQPPCLEERKGVIRGYILYYCEVQRVSSAITCLDDNSQMWNISVEEFHEVMSRELQQLHPFTEYAVWLSAYTSIGIAGPNSTQMWNRTSQGTPSAPQKVKVLNRTATEITIEWQPPSKPNGNIEEYKVKYNSDFVLTNQTRVTLTQLLGYTTYSIRLQACSGASTAPCGELSDEIFSQTLIGVPGKPGPPVVSWKSSGQVVISITAPSTPNGPVEFYKVFFKEPSDTEYVEYMYYSETLTNQMSDNTVVVNVNCENVKTDADYVFAVKAVNSRDGEILVSEMSDPSGQVKLCYYQPDIVLIVALIVVGTIFAIVIISCVTISWRKYKKSELALPVPAAKLPPQQDNERDQYKRNTDDTYEVYDVLQNQVSSKQYGNGYGPHSARYQRQSSGGYSDTSQRSDTKLISETDRDAPIDEDEDEVFPLKFQDYHKSRKQPLRIDIPKHYVNHNGRNTGLLTVHSPDSGIMAGSPGYNGTNDSLPLVRSSTGSSQIGSMSDYLQMMDDRNGNSAPPPSKEGNRLASIDSGFGFNCLSPIDTSAPISLSALLLSEDSNVTYSQLSPDGKLAPVSIDGLGDSRLTVDVGSGINHEMTEPNINYKQLSPDGKLAPVSLVDFECDKFSEQGDNGLEYSRIASDGTLSPVKKTEPAGHFKHRSAMIVPPTDITVMSAHGGTNSQGDTCYILEENMKNPKNSPTRLIKQQPLCEKASLDNSRDKSDSQTEKCKDEKKKDTPPVSTYVPIEEAIPVNDNLYINQLPESANNERIHIHALLDNPVYIPSASLMPATENDQQILLHNPGYASNDACRPVQPDTDSTSTSSEPVYVNSNSAPFYVNADVANKKSGIHGYVNQDTLTTFL